MESNYGNLIIIGGAEDKTDRRDILNEIVKKIHGAEGDIAILTTATSYPKEVGFVYLKTFKEIGFERVKVIDIRSREEANEDSIIYEIEKAKCLFFTGGDQLKITSIIGGTKLYEAVKRAFLEGKLIAGTSAGASCICTTMMVSGVEEIPPTKCKIKMAPGLDIIKGVIIDQHFSQRGRIGRLLNAVAHNPEIIGIGIDEDTAIVFEGTPQFRVIGSGAVTVVDGKDISFSDISDIENDEKITIFNSKVHILPQNYGFDLKERKPLKKILHEVEKDEADR